jgi:stress-induced morphogen
VRDPIPSCGESFEVEVVSSSSRGSSRSARHRLIHDALKNEMASIHALSIKKSQTPEQAAAAAAQ